QASPGSASPTTVIEKRFGQARQSRTISGGGPSGSAARSTPLTSCTRPRNHTSKSSVDWASVENAFSVSSASKCTSISDPMGDCCNDHSSLVTPPRFCDAENSSLRPIVSWANLRTFVVLARQHRECSHERGHVNTALLDRVRGTYDPLERSGAPRHPSSRRGSAPDQQAAAQG